MYLDWQSQLPSTHNRWVCPVSFFITLAGLLSFLDALLRVPVCCQSGEGKQAFHVVAPSLPGYAFSSAPKHKGFGLQEIAKTFNQLMLELGYTQYVAQGEKQHISLQMFAAQDRDATTFAGGCCSAPPHIIVWCDFQAMLISVQSF